VANAASFTGLPESVVAAQISDESGFNPNAVSPTGADGIAQFEPDTWATWGNGSPFNPSDAFVAYQRFMRSLLRQFNGNVRDALAAYNAGPGNISAGMGYADSILSAANQSISVTAAQGSGGSGQPNVIPGWMQGVLGLIPGGSAITDLGGAVGDIQANIVDWLERGALMLFGGILIIMGVIRLSEGQKDKAAVAPDKPDEKDETEKKAGEIEEAGEAAAVA
jgi:hypothetical protein